MVTYESSFVGDFKLGDNIVFNLSTLRYLYELYEAGNDQHKRYLQKPITILNISIIEALLHDFYTRMKTFTREGVAGVSKDILARIGIGNYDEFGNLISSAKRYDFFDQKHNSFYETLDELRKLRNRVHIQNTKRQLEPDDHAAFSAARMIQSEQALERVIETLQRKYPRKQSYTGSFVLPWNSHIANDPVT